MKAKWGRHFPLRTVTLLLVQALIVLPLPTLATGEHNVHLYGALVAEPCVIAPGDEEITLDFGTIIDKYLYLNTRTLGQPFEIRLRECDLTLAKSVRVMFTGKKNSVLPDLLAIDGGSEATGIAIGFETPSGQPMPLNTQSDKWLLQERGGAIAMKAYVQGEPQAIAGQTIGRGAFSAVAIFNLEYE
ncbi:exotoxin (plasmid) [Serratia marcescens]|uniref:fimbrial protein n=1 Tax=Serratia marcescens TaxID=615 RepID=UPI0006ED0C64|nr:fimbrial protein [Serratia marcescens]ALL40507.1 exotoxin [Serratia marcescens]